MNKTDNYLDKHRHKDVFDVHFDVIDNFNNDLIVYKKKKNND